MGWSHIYLTLNFLQIREKTEFKQTCSEDWKQQNRHGSKRACCTGDRCIQATRALPQGCSLPVSSAPLKIQMGTLCCRVCGLLLALALPEPVEMWVKSCFHARAPMWRTLDVVNARILKKRVWLPQGCWDLNSSNRPNYLQVCSNREWPPGLWRGCGATAPGSLQTSQHLFWRQVNLLSIHTV